MQCQIPRREGRQSNDFSSRVGPITNFHHYFIRRLIHHWSSLHAHAFEMKSTATDLVVALTPWSMPISRSPDPIWSSFTPRSCNGTTLERVAIMLKKGGKMSIVVSGYAVTRSTSCLQDINHVSVGKKITSILSIFGCNHSPLTNSCTQLPPEAPIPC